jgi:hypothetical protein
MSRIQFEGFAILFIVNNEPKLSITALKKNPPLELWNLKYSINQNNSAPTGQV